MNHGFHDILSRIDERPSWYDSNGTPRYGEFTPQMAPNIYTTQVVLLRIACQACGEEFAVEMHSTYFSPIDHPAKLHYGDPPRHNCVGDTMNCDDLEVLQVWHKPRSLGEWERVPSLEGIIDEEAYR